MTEPLVSICCITYNHAQFIRQCLDGFVMQKTNFQIEVLIHDDASTDGTADIIREYEHKYPDLIKPIYQKENQYSKGIKITRTYNFPRAQGKYLAMCEGDDYWIDEYKLQKQVDFLEANEDFSICFHPVKMYNENKGSFVKDFVLDVPDVTDLKTLASVGNYIHTPSVMYRKNQKAFDGINNLPKLPIGDYPNLILHAKYGKIKKLPEIMAVYRLHNGGVWELKPIEYKISIWLKVLVELMNHFIEDQELCSIFVEQHKKYSTLIFPNISVHFYTIYFNTGNGYLKNQTQKCSYTGNVVNISCQIPEKTLTVRLDPIYGYGCVISNLEIFSNDRLINYNPINGYKDKNGDIIFTNSNPQIELHGAVFNLDIKYQILVLPEPSYYGVLDNYIITCKDKDRLETEKNSLLNSRSWRFSKPLRVLASFIRRHKILRLFAKSLLSIKRNGIKETVKKFITSTRRELLSRKIDTLFFESEYQENKDFSLYKPNIKAIAFYLPQFHTIPENDEWWGKGFTEWTNTRKTTPRFKEHYQPREPHKDFGYYDLLNIGTLEKQAKLAKQHGIYGFCFYLYWFSGKRLLEKPLDLFLTHPEININFCLCWANENWTRRWDGQDKEILIKQNYSDDDPYNFIKDIQKYIADKRYIRINNKPIILVYNPNNIPNARDVFIKWKFFADKIGIGKITILACKTFGNITDTLDENIIDWFVEFPPHNTRVGPKKKYFLKKKTGNIYDYKEAVSAIINEFSSTRNKSLLRTCMMSWDNAARKANEWSTFAGFSLKLFFDWVSLIVTEALQTEKPFFFINAWNEWAEGTYLEPDKKYGYANINTLSKAIFGLPFDNIIQLKNKKLLLINKKFTQVDNIKICVQIHLFYLDLIDEIIMNLNYLPFLFHCYISTDTDEKVSIIQDEFSRRCNRACRIYVQCLENRGRDVAPFIEQMGKSIDNYEYVLHIHTKKSLTSEGYGNEWRKYLYKHLLGNTMNIYRIIKEFTDNNDLGLLFPKIFPKVKSFMRVYKTTWGTDNKQAKDNVYEFLKRIGVETFLGRKPIFPAGNMFWARTKAIKRVFNSDIKRVDFPEENNQEDMTLAHAIERSWVYIAKNEGFTFKQIPN